MNSNFQNSNNVRTFFSIEHSMFEIFRSNIFESPVFIQGTNFVGDKEGAGGSGKDYTCVFLQSNATSLVFVYNPVLKRDWWFHFERNKL